MAFGGAVVNQMKLPNTNTTTNTNVSRTNTNLDLNLNTNTKKIQMWSVYGAWRCSRKLDETAKYTNGGESTPILQTLKFL